LRSEYERPKPVDDGLVKADVGTWAKRKHYFIGRYINAFTTSMRGNWKSLHYVDLFAGSGMEMVRDGDLDWGSPLLAATARFKFSQLHLCELDRSGFEALEARLNAFPQPSPPQLLCGDANEKVHEVIPALPSDGLTLALVDPWRLDDLRFETLAALAQRRCDLIVFFPDHLDALRNLETYRGKADSPLSKYFGSADWEAAIEGVAKENLGERLLEFFKGRLRTLGYEFFAETRIQRTDTRRLYMLVFASKHERGAEIWRGISMKDFDGQRDLKF
jgi:three-Cys-motif partner protein